MEGNIARCKYKLTYMCMYLVMADLIYLGGMADAGSLYGTFKVTAAADNGRL